MILQKTVILEFDLKSSAVQCSAKRNERSSMELGKNKNKTQILNFRPESKVSNKVRDVIVSFMYQ